MSVLSLPDPAESMRQQAAAAIRREVREAIRPAIQTADRTPRELTLDQIEDLVVGALSQRRVAWALAYIAGVQMAPGLLAGSVGEGAP